MAAASVYVPSVSTGCLWSLWEALQDQLVGLTQAPFKLLLLPWVLEGVRCLECTLRMESVFHSLPSSPNANRAAFKVRRFRGLSSQCRTPMLGRLMWGSDHSLFGGNFRNCNYLPICGSPTCGYESWLYCNSAPPTHLVVVPSLYL